jgi:signal transduction histidine kinase
VLLSQLNPVGLFTVKSILYLRPYIVRLYLWSDRIRGLMRDHSGSKVIHLMGIVSCLCLIPRLFHDDREEDKEDSEFLEVVRSNQFENMVLVSLALAVPSVLDMLADILEKRSTAGLFDDAQLSRIVLAVSLLSQPLLLYHFAIQREDLIATYAAKNFRAIACGTVVVEQLYVRCSDMFTIGRSSLMLILWNLGSVVGSYTTDQEPTTGALSFVSTFLKNAGGILLLVCLFRQYARPPSPKETSRYEKWHFVAFEALIIITLVTNTVFGAVYSYDNIYELSDTYILGTAYLATMFQFLYASIMTQQYRFDLVVAKEKLSIKRQFVRYVSHEVRTPLNSCSLGLSYLRNLCEKKISQMAAHTRSAEGNEDTISGSAAKKEAYTTLHSSLDYGVVSEDFRTMLTVIDEIADCCDTAVDFMNNMLFYEKIDTMDLALYFKSENLRAICDKSYHAFLLSSRHLDIDFTFEVHDSISEASGICPFIRADYSKVNVVFRNLISNALKFSSPGGKVRFRLVPITRSNSEKQRDGLALHQLDSIPSASEEATTHYRAIVEDEGIGMTAEEQCNLFNTVIQFNPNDSQSGGGSGLGLYLSQKILRDHDATIEVYSEGVRGRGTKFFIDFPKNDGAMMRSRQSDDDKRVDGDLEADTVPVGVASCVPLKLLTKPLHELEIMIVDDSLISRKMLQRSMEQHNVGGTHDQAGDGVELLNMIRICNNNNDAEDDLRGSGNGNDRQTSKKKKYRVHPSFTPTIMKTYDIIVIDKSMPLMDGDVATAKLREWGYDGLIFGLTGNALAEDLKSFCDMGANYAFSKPLNMEQFIKTLQEYYV